jgi:primosomal protein N' (replication factor Y)
MKLICEVALPLPTKKLYLYLIPKRLQGKILEGTRVVVPAKNIKKITGYVIRLLPYSQEFERGDIELKEIIDILDVEPMIDSNLLGFLKKTAEYYLHPLGHVLKSALPSGINVQTKNMIRLSKKGKELLQKGIKDPFKEQVLRVLSKSAYLRVETLCKRIPGLTKYKIELLINQGLIAKREIGQSKKALFEFQRGKWLFSKVKPNKGPTLNRFQEQAVKEITEALRKKKYVGFLLYGVTGSGKTEVYIRAISEVVKQGGRAIVLVPEIALTPQLVSRFKERFGDIVGVFHSGLSPRQRYIKWREIQQGRFSIVIGARSALFVPLPHLRLIVVDEEHDSSFKQEEKFRYNARDLALLRAKELNGVVVLGSATPSLEMYHNVRLGKLRLLRLPERVTMNPLPEVIVVNLNQYKWWSKNFLSPPLVNGLRQTLSAGEQAILFLNRRGFAPWVICRQCGEPVRCKACSISLVFHQRANILQCHYCGYKEPFPSECIYCGFQGLYHVGIGIQKVEEIVKRKFPGVKVARLDRDTASKEGAEKILDDLRQRRIDLLIGTQMVTKGHDFPGVTFVGVILADITFTLPDFRAAERAFQLLEQVSGRAGRSSKQGRVIIQTLRPQHITIQCMKSHNLSRFYYEELSIRKKFFYPPFYRLASLIFSGRKEEQVFAEAKRYGDLAREILSKSKTQAIFILGPAPAPIPRLSYNFRFRLLLKGKTSSLLQNLLLELFEKKKHPSFGVNLTLDIDPVNMM